MQAGKDLGVTVTYQSDGDASKQSQLIDAAIATKPDGLVVSMANPDGVQDAIKRAVAAGIPVIVTNKGDSRWQEVGAETYVGQSELVAGQEVGKRLKTAGLKNVLCVIQEVGNTGLQDRCKGVAQELGGVTTNIQVDGANVADAQNVIKSALLADPSIDGVVTLNSPISPAASQAIKEASSSAKLAGFELSTDVLTMIEKGDMLFAVDQQPYLQGYLPVTFLTDQVRNGDVVGGGQPVYTGPGFVTADNAAQIATFAKNGTR
jgi:simple sugar transport system substrate-binding protein